MVIAFQIILLILLPFSLFGVIGERKDKNLRDMMVAIFFSCSLAFMVSVLWL